MEKKPVAVLFICLGNICRSPTAEAVFTKKVAEKGLTRLFSIDSAGTSAYHIGSAPDARAIQVAAAREYQLEDLRARELVVDDFFQYDYILAMDKQNLTQLQLLQPESSTAALSLLLDYLPSSSPYSEVPDPYYGQGNGFETVLDLIETGIDAFLLEILKSSDN